MNRPSRWRTWLLILLLVLPLFGFLGIAVWAIWQTGWAWAIWFLWPIAWGLAWLLARSWNVQLLNLQPVDLESLPHWTERDENAYELVQTFADRASDLQREKLTDPLFYSELGQEIGLEVARVYHPEATDPFRNATVVEILTAAELAMDDLAELVEKYVPGSELLTIRQWQQLGSVPKKIKKVSPFLWAASALIAPQATLGRFAASKAITQPIGDQLQANVIAWFYRSFVNRVGYYLIEMNSGRLRGGAQRFRETFGAHIPGAAIGGPQGETELAAISGTYSAIVTGFPAAGKSTVIRHLIADESQDAVACKLGDATITIRELPHRDPASLNKKETKSLRADLANADVSLHVVNATQPDADKQREFLSTLRGWLSEDASQRPPPMVVVLTHIDELPEQSEETESPVWMQQFVDACGELCDAVVPLALPADADEVYGVEEILRPKLIELLPHIAAISRQREWAAETNKGKYGRALKQAFSVGKELFKAGTRKK